MLYGNKFRHTTKLTIQMTTIEVPVKPYIKEYLESNFGNPVNFSGVRGINDFFVLLLERQTHRRDKQTTLSNYKCSVTIVITRDVFYRYGWDLSATAIVSFNALFEYIIKMRSRDIIRTKHRDAKIKIAPAIRQVQCELQFPEESFSFDAIKKDLQRHTNIFKSSNANKKVLGNVSLKKNVK